jgi:hypothetical protein
MVTDKTKGRLGCCTVPYMLHVARCKRHVVRCNRHVVRCTSVPPNDDGAKDSIVSNETKAASRASGERDSSPVAGLMLESPDVAVLMPRKSFADGRSSCERAEAQSCDQGTQALPWSLMQTAAVGIDHRNHRGPSSSSYVQLACLPHGGHECHTAFPCGATLLACR